MGPEKMSSGIPEDPSRQRVREHLEIIQSRGAKASIWRETIEPLRQLINREGHVPVTTRLTPEDLDFLAEARDDVLTLTELVLRLLELHQPRDAGGITTDPSRPILRCRSCMWRWPCPTFRAMSEAFAPRERPERINRYPIGTAWQAQRGLHRAGEGAAGPRVPGIPEPAGGGEAAGHDVPGEP
ncbi:hypothetical protein TBS_18030 [Thermobispora bispora]|mgnify:CR=1 FL=1|jgi:hypothetical protein|uniref:Uncharacterized protein n=2 Tax=Thermobispora bispora TaxID=2006 RepID=D6Y238_THEBD|nr:hypothetical protein Tbis_0036 [Thermobispora bispora DSM 43833]